MAGALCDEGGLEVRVGHLAPVVDTLGELECMLDVFASGLEVALSAMAAGAPVIDVGAEPVARQIRALGQRESLVEQRDRGRDAGKLVAADAEAEHELGAVDVREHRALGGRAGAVQQLDGGANIPLLHACPGLTGERAHLELDRVRGRDCGARLRVGIDGVLVAVRLRECLGACEQRLDAAALVGRDATGEKRGIDFEALRQPLDGLGGRARLAALDLADVLLGEAVAGELGLRHAGGHAQQPQPVAEARPSGCGNFASGGGSEFRSWRRGTSVD